MFVTRFAPSPTGYLHLGHAFSALTAFDAAINAGGRFLVRIEDTDAGRCRAEFESAIYEDLAWLGLHWETPVRRQSAHMPEYSAALDRLIDMGVMYRCFKTRKDLLADIAHAPHGHIEPYRGDPLPRDLEAAKIASGEAFAWRLSLNACQAVLGLRWTDLGAEIDGTWTRVNPAIIGDAVIARKEFPASYHLASVVDDGLQGVTHIIRGEDLSEAPHLHVLLQVLLDIPTPIYQHHRLILDDDGKRLAKRNQAMTLRAMRDAGVTPSDIRQRLGFCR
jgi:glutamyl-Q tRNA(Asp) synthetase